MGLPELFFIMESSKFYFIDSGNLDALFMDFLMNFVGLLMKIYLWRLLKF